MALTESTSMGNDLIWVILFFPCALRLRNFAAHGENENRSELSEKSWKNEKKSQNKNSAKISYYDVQSLCQKSGLCISGRVPPLQGDLLAPPEKPATNQDPDLGFFKEFWV